MQKRQSERKQDKEILHLSMSQFKNQTLYGFVMSLVHMILFAHKIVLTGNKSIPRVYDACMFV